MNKKRLVNYLLFSIGVLLLLTAFLAVKYNITGKFIDKTGGVTGNSVVQVTRVMTPAEPVEEIVGGLDQPTTNPDTPQDEIPEEDQSNQDLGRGSLSLPGDISSCQEIDIEGIYTLDRNLISLGSTCFNVTVDDVVLDCQGYSITGNGTENAISSFYADNLSINNCSFSNFSRGVLFTNSNNGELTDSLINNCSTGVYFSSSSNNQIVRNEFNDSRYGIYATSSSDNNSIISNLINNSGLYGMDIVALDGWVVENNIILNSNTSGILIETGDGSRLINNTLVGSEKGIEMDNSFYNSNLSFNFIGSASIAGIYSSAADLSVLIINNTFENNSNGTYLRTAGTVFFQQNNFTNNNIAVNLYEVSSYTNTFFDNVFMNSSEVGIYLYRSSLQNITSNNFTQNERNFEIILTPLGTTSCNHSIEGNFISSGEEIYYVGINESITLADLDLGELIVCGSSNISFDNITLIGEESFGIGLNLVRSNESNFTNFQIINHSKGIVLESGEQLIFENDAFDNLDVGIELDRNSEDNSFTNLSFISRPVGSYDFYINGNDTQIIDSSIERIYFNYTDGFSFKDSSYGEIKFLESLYGNVNNVSAEIIIGNNSAYVDEAVSVSALNKSANVTLYNIRTDFSNPAIIVDDYLCDPSICYNYTSLNAGNVTFNVTHWSEYYIDEYFYELFDCDNLTVDNGVYKLNNAVNSTGNCFNVSAENVTLDCRTWDHEIVYGNSSSGTETYYGVFSNMQDTTVINCQIRMGSESTGAEERYAVYYNNSAGGLVDRVNASNNRQGIVLGGDANDNNITNCIANDNEQTGVYLITNNGSYVYNTTANRNKFGLRIYWISDNNTFANNTVINNTDSGIYLGPWSDSNIIQYNDVQGNGKGISVDAGADNIFDSNTVVENTYGVYVNASNDTIVNSSTIANNTLYGVYLMGSDSSLVRDNNISGSNVGAYSYEGNSEYIRDNLIFDNTKGVSLDSNCAYSGVNGVFGNNITDNTQGIFTIAVRDLIYTNYILENDYGLVSTDDCGFALNNTIYNNYFNSTINVNDTSSGNYWNTTSTTGPNIYGSTNIGGNYWPDYTGYDVTGDGLGDRDTPWNESGGILVGGDYLPLTDVGYGPVIVELYVNSTNGMNVTNETLTCWVNSTDGNSDAVNYTGYWYRNGTQYSIITANNNYTSGELVAVSNISSALTTKGDNWSCYIVGTDGVLSGVGEHSSNLTIENAAPYFNPVVEDQSVLENEVFSYDMNCSDIDGDTPQYFINDTEILLYPSTGIMSWDKPNYTEAGNYSYEIKCGDGEDNSTDVFVLEVVNVNRLPSLENITLNATSSANATGDNLTVYIGNASDADLESIKNITNWNRDGSSFAVLNMPFESGVNDYTGNTYSIDSTNITSSTGYDGNGAYDFNGEDSVINVSGSSLNVESVTIAAWIYPGTSLLSQYVVSKGDKDYALAIDGATGNLTFLIANSTTAASVSNAAQYDLSLNTWSFIIASYNGTDARLYVDGSLVDSSTSVSGILNNSGNIMRIGNYGADYFNGTIDELIIYGEALSAEQIMALYNNRTDLIVSQETLGGEVWQACVTPNDGEDDGIEVCSNNLTIINQAPVMQQLIMNATSADNLSSDNLSCYANATDGDGEDLTYEGYWSKNGVQNLSISLSGQSEGSLVLVSTLLFGNTTRLENWTCTVRATDGGDTTEYNTSGIVTINQTYGVCGNSLIETEEECDTANVSTETCVTQGFSTGTLACSATCYFDTSGCSYTTTPSSSGGGGGGSSVASITLTNYQFFSGYTTGSLPRRSRVYLTLDDGTEHSIYVQSVDSDSVDLIIESDPIEITIVEGEERILDITGDGKSDLRLKVIEISPTNKVILLIKKYLVSTTPTVPTTPTTPTTPTDSGTATSTPTPEEKGVLQLFFEKIIGFKYIKIIAIVIGSLVALLIVLFLMRSRSKEEEVDDTLDQAREWYEDGRNKGYSPSAIHKVLSERGWDHEKIDEIMGADALHAHEAIRTQEQKTQVKQMMRDKKIQEIASAFKRGEEKRKEEIRRAMMKAQAKENAQKPATTQVNKQPVKK